MDQHRRIPVDIACTLDDTGLDHRLAQWESLADRIVSVRDGDQGFRVAFRADPDVVAELPVLAALETGCCGFAGWRVEREGELVELVVTGEASALAGLREVFGARS